MVRVTGVRRYRPEIAGPPDPPSSWSDAWDTDDQATIDAWYESHTGYDAYVAPELGRQLTLSDLTQQSGSFDTSENGQTFYRMDFRDVGSIGVDHDDVTFIGCRFSYSTVSSAMINQPSGKRLTMEYCTFYGSSTTEANSRVVYFRDSQEATIRYCKVPDDSLVGSSFARIEQMQGEGDGILLEYNYIRWIGSFEDRATAIALRCDTAPLNNVTIRRNNIRGRASACVTMYNRGVTSTHPDAVMSDVRWEENVFNVLDRDLRQGEPYEIYSWPQNWYDGAGYTFYATRFGQSTEGGDPTNPLERVAVVDNRFGRWSYPACGGAKPALTSGMDLPSNTWSGNRMLGGDKAAVDHSGGHDFGSRDDWTFVGDEETTGSWEKNA